MGKKIYVRRTRSADELGGAQDWEGLDVDESIARFDDLVIERVADRFPDVEVELTEGTWGAAGFEDKQVVIATLREIQDEVFRDADEWVVRT